MEAVFFVGRPEDAAGVASVDDLPDGPASDPIAIDSPGAISGLVSALAAELQGGVRPLRDATCQSFPVWIFSRKLAAVVEGLDDDRLDAAAYHWKDAAGDALSDPNIFELSVCLSELRDALRFRAPGERLFVLLEEKAW